MAARGSASRSVERSRGCWAAKFVSSARLARAASSRSSCPAFTSRRRRRRRAEDRRSRVEDRHARNGAIRDPRYAIRDLQPSSGDYGEIIEVADDRNNFKPGDRVALIIEDDAPFAQVLLDIAHERGFKGVVASQGSAALWLAHRYKPDVITLDIRLPDRDGWTVLDRLKHDPKTSHIPVHVITADDREIQPRRLGALTYLRKPVTREHLVEAFVRVAEFAGRRTRRLLVVEGDDAQRASVVDLIGDGAVRTTAVATGEEALASLRGAQFDCMALNPKLPDMSGAELIEAMRREPSLLDLPIIVYDRKDLSREEEARFRAAAEAMIVKEAPSPERDRKSVV